jgi:hypothetical protein
VEISVLTHRKNKIHTIKFKKTHNKSSKTHYKAPKHAIKFKNTQTGNTIKTKGLGASVNVSSG